jgi:hypothetical protein
LLDVSATTILLVPMSRPIAPVFMLMTSDFPTGAWFLLSIFFSF